MSRGIVLVAVDAHDDGDVLALGRGGYQDFLRPGIDVLACVGRVREASGRFEHDLYTELAPRQGCRILLGEHANLVTVDNDRFPARVHVPGIRSMDRVVLEEVRERARVGEVVDRDEIEVRDTLLFCSAKHLPADSTEAVDTDPDCHFSVNSYGNSRSPEAGARPNVV